MISTWDILMLSLPSGKRWHNYGKIHHFLMANSTISTGPCSIVFGMFTRPGTFLLKSKNSHAVMAAMVFQWVHRGPDRSPRTSAKWTGPVSGIPSEDNFWIHWTPLVRLVTKIKGYDLWYDIYVVFIDILHSQAKYVFFWLVLNWRV